jgi:hypothetical protein
VGSLLVAFVRTVYIVKENNNMEFPQYVSQMAPDTFLNFCKDFAQLDSTERVIARDLLVPSFEELQAVRNLFVSLKEQLTRLEKITMATSSGVQALQTQVSQVQQQVTAMQAAVASANTRLLNSIAALQAQLAGSSPGDPAAIAAAVTSLQQVSASLQSVATSETAEDVTTLTISPSTLTIAAGATQQFSANIPVNWSAANGSITQAGLYTAPTGGTTDTVTAISTDGTNQTASVSVSVSPSTTPQPFVISPSQILVAPGANQQFATLGGPSGPNPIGYAAQNGTITSSGLYTAPASGFTSDVVTATAADGVTTATCQVTIGSIDSAAQNASVKNVAAASRPAQGIKPGK